MAAVTICSDFGAQENKICFHSPPPAICHRFKKILKRWQEYTEELYKKDLHDPDNHDGVITHTHLGQDILECKVGLRKHHYEQS